MSGLGCSLQQKPKTLRLCFAARSYWDGSYESMANMLLLIFVAYLCWNLLCGYIEVELEVLFRKLAFETYDYQNRKVGAVPPTPLCNYMMNSRHNSNIRIVFITCPSFYHT